MKVLFLTNLPSPYRVRFFTELGKKCELTVVYERKSASDRNDKWKEKTGTTYREIFLRGKEIGTDNSICPEVVRYLNKKYEVVVIGMYSTYTAMMAMAWMKLKGIDYVISTDGGFVREESWIKKEFKRFWLSSAKYWLGTGKIARDYLCYYGAKSDLIFDYPFTSVDKSDLIPAIINKREKKIEREKMGIFADKVVISVGQFIPRKGFDILLQASKGIRCTDVEFVLVGGTEDEFRKLISEKIPGNVKIYPFMEKKALFKYYRIADLFVLPTREDVWGLVVNEAMSCGLPVITTDHCGAGVELVQNGENGYIVKNGDEKELESVLEQMLASDNLEEQGVKSLERIQKYTFQEMAERCYEVFEKNLQ